MSDVVIRVENLSKLYNIEVTKYRHDTLRDAPSLIVSPGSVDELAKAIKFLLSHKEKRSGMGANGRKRVENCIDIEDTIAKIRAVMLS